MEQDGVPRRMEQCAALLCIRLSSTLNLSLATVRLDVAVYIALLDCVFVVLSVLRLWRVGAGLVYPRPS